MRTVLFVCVANAGRSLIAEAVFNAAPPKGWRAVSAGTEPGSAPHARTGTVLAEIGLALPDHPPRLLTPAMMDGADRWVTMGCLDHASCPARLRRDRGVDWALPDPESLDDAGFRAVRDEIRRRVDRLRTELESDDGGSRSAPPG